ncbi:MAG: IreB family regulatory phosphoprotein [Tissierellia bacterium]|nr:IreB family regulatory phosphoprotein [Tissierellia bacterium]
MSDQRFNTMKFSFHNEEPNQIRLILSEVYEALEEKGYNPIDQLIGYVLSGDPTYITSHRNARALIVEVERDELLGELLNNYLNN